MIIDKVHLAKMFSRLFHPFVVCIPSLWLAIYLHTRSLWMAFAWSAVTLVVFLLPLWLFIRIMVRAGRYSDLDISVREQRHSAYLAAGVSLLLLLLVYALLGAPRIAYACVSVIVLATLLCAMINRFTKVSLHTMVVASCATALGYLCWPAGVGLGFGAIAVGWARVHLEHHTVGQVALALVMAFVSATVVFSLYF